MKPITLISASLIFILFGCQSTRHFDIGKRYALKQVKRTSSAQAITESQTPKEDMLYAEIREMPASQQNVLKTLIETAAIEEALIENSSITEIAKPVRENKVKDSKLTERKLGGHFKKSIKKPLVLFPPIIKKAPNDRLILEIILAILLPPLGVYVHEQAFSTNFWVSLILTLFFWVPGIIFALLVVGDII